MIRRAAKFLLALAIYGLACLALTIGSSLLTRDCLVVEKRFDIAVVLGGGREGEDLVLKQETGRIHAGILLYNRDLVPRLHLTGGGNPATNPSSALGLAEIAREKSIPKSAISLETRSLSTLQNVLFSRPDLPKDADLLLVTEAFHAWRAWASFLWGGRPATVCASPSPGRASTDKARVLMRETGSWAVNIPRAGIWSLAHLVGLEEVLPTDFLA